MKLLSSNSPIRFPLPPAISRIILFTDILICLEKSEFVPERKDGNELDAT